MGFPSSPTNGQQVVVNNITYVYNSSKGAWLRLSTPGVPLSANSLVLTSPNVSISTTSGALVVTGGAGIGGNLHADRYYTHNGLYWANNNESILGILTYGNVEVNAFLVSQNITSANIGGSQTFANANAASQAVSINTINANIGAYQTYANANVVAIQANLGAFQTFSNSNSSTQATSINNINANIGAYQTYANTKIGTNTNSNLVVVATTTSTSTSTGAVVVAGGAGVAGNVYTNALYTTTGLYWAGNGSAFSSGGGTPGGTDGQIQFNNSSVFGGANILFNSTNGNLVITSATNSTSTTTGALIVAGGVGSQGTITGNIIEAQNSYAAAGVTPELKTIQSSQSFNVITNASAGAFNPSTVLNDTLIYFTKGTINTGTMIITPHATGAAGIRLVSNGMVIINNTAAATSTTSGALVVNGGAGITGNVFVGNVSAANTVVFPTEFDNGNSGASFTINWRNRQKQRITLTANCVLSYTAPIGVGNFIIKLIQDGTGGRFITWPAGTRWPGAVAPTLTTTANAVDIVSIYYDGTNYYSQFGLNFG